MSNLSLNLSVIICTHSPRQDYLDRTLSALELQSLPMNQWELIVVDNASNQKVEGRFDVSWHPNGRHIVETKLGLTHARLRGISESNGDTIIFVDDDNVLAPTYLQTALEIGNRYPFLGAWGGSIVPEFESPPPEWTRPHWGSIAIREVFVDRWSNISDDWMSTPIGAGVCIRGIIANEYLKATKQSQLALSLGRIGKNGLGGGEDEDMIATVLNSGLGKGVFKDLILTHLIPSSRLELPYLLRLTEQGTKTGTMLQFKNHGTWRSLDTGLALYRRVFGYYIRRDNLGLQFYLAKRRGIKSALATGEIP